MGEESLTVGNLRKRKGTGDRGTGLPSGVGEGRDREFAIVGHL